MTRISEIVPRGLVRASISLALLYLGVAALIAIAGLEDDIEPSDVAIVLGSKVQPDGSASPRLAARLKEARRLYELRLIKHIIVSGGTGMEGYSESTVMRDYLVTRGVARGDVLTDMGGTTTWATAQGSAKIMRRMGWSSALVVSQYFHVPRARLALQAQGIEHVHGAHARYFEWRDIYSTLREVPALVRYWLRATF